MTRTVLVTGGGTGMGYAIAARFAADGDEVYITGRRAEVLQKAAAALGEQVHAMPCDHTDPERILAAVAQLPGRLHVLVNNLGGAVSIGLPEPDSLAGLAERWRSDLNKNLLAAVLTTYAVAERLADGAAVVHIGSRAADLGDGSYGAAKAGLASWNIDIARTLGPRGVTSNVVSPSFTGGTDLFGDTLTAEQSDQWIAETFLGRAGTPTDIAETVYFLASPGARYITGQVINVDGGARTVL
ncbi:SDR family NAD(P)-dependent oxidoreductase [Nocardia altamirensis]|uniref:SDR family NAD(P)-dependent oxidoreductase n=1 Tax=Nocardia altamirensis TaxID=472158 RepID=UPI0008408F3D|nr:SDR family oxidoreductase [Nocardia altamirensis]